jgi:hypothetical protein
MEELCEVGEAGGEAEAEAAEKVGWAGGARGGGHGLEVGPGGLFDQAVADRDLGPGGGGGGGGPNSSGGGGEEVFEGGVSRTGL